MVKPETTIMPAPGQCIILNNIPKVVNEPDIAPDTKVIAFMMN